MRKILITMAAVLFTALQVSSQTAFVSKRLSNIAKAIGVVSPTDSISYHGQQITIRSNDYGEIEHIGYRLFSSEMRHNMCLYVSDFLERYMLELDLPSRVVQPDRKNLTVTERMNIDKVLMTGNKALLMNIDSLTVVNVEDISLQYYKVRLARGDSNFEVDFPKNSQLLMGMDIQELEERLVQCLKRQEPAMPENVDPEGQEIQTLHDVRIGKINRDVIKILGKSYLNLNISDCLYVMPAVSNSSLYVPVQDVTQPEMSVQNIMIRGINSDMPIKMTVDMYRNVKDTLTSSVNRWLGLCRNEGCQMYFGIKEINDTIVTGVVFALNKALAMHHMLSVSFPLSLLYPKEKTEHIVAKLYAYIPLDNLTEKYFYYRPLP